MNNKSDYLKNIENAERRFAQHLITVEKRMDGDQETETGIIEGYAAKFNEKTELWPGHYEVLKPGCFDDVLTDDVRCLFNHSPNYVLARTASGTLELSVDEIGLKYRYKSPNRTFANDLKDAIKSGDVSQSSFGFSVRSSNWTKQEVDGEMQYTREVVKVKKLYDVSPVTYPAYQNTTVAQRSFGNFEKEEKPTIKRRMDVFDAMLEQNKRKLK